MEFHNVSSSKAYIKVTANELKPIGSSCSCDVNSLVYLRENAALLCKNIAIIE